MKRAKIVLTTITTLFALLLLLGPTARALDSIDDDTRYVADPHTGPAAKLSAMHRLAERGAEARRAIPALLRQTGSGMQVVRDAARDTLVRVAGFEEGSRLLAELPPAGDDALTVLRKRWLDGKVTWAATDELRQLMDNDADRATEFAADTVLKLARTDPRGAAGLTANARRDLLTGVSRAAAARPKRHAEFLDAVDVLGAAHAPAEAVHLLLRIAAANGPGGPDPELGDRARQLLATALDAKNRSPGAIPGLAAGLADPGVTALAQTLVPTDAIGPLKGALAYEVARRAELGDFDPLALVKRNDVDPDTFAQAVRRRFESQQADTTRLQLLRALQLAGAGPAVAKTQGLHSLVVQCLGRPAVLAEQAARADFQLRAGVRITRPAPVDFATADALAAAARELLLAGNTPHTAEQALATAVGQGQTLTPALIRAFQPDRRELAGLLQPHLTQGSAGVRLSAVKTLAAVGVPADADATDTRAALDALVRSSDPDLRRAAAEALDTPAARDLVRVPDLLRDLTADAPGTRQVAARQLQSLAIESPEIAALLVRATDQGDMATREGLRLALERSFATARPAKEVLAELAAATNRDATTRAYARAALRQLPP